MVVVEGAMIEPNWSTADSVEWSDGIERVQFERTGYFCIEQGAGDRLVWNRTVALKDSWGK